MLTKSTEYRVRIEKNLAYKTGAGLSPYEQECCKLDLYLPENITAFPTIVWLHGGGMEGGCKDGESIMAKYFASRGIAVAPVEYRLSPQATYPAYVDDAAASVAWVLKHIADYSGSARSVFIAGHSAGGYLTAIISMDPSYLAKYGVQLTDIAGTIPMSGQMFTHFTIRKERGIPDPWNTPTIDEAAPCYHVHQEPPPLLAMCGDHDIPARAEENRYFITMLQSLGHMQTEYREFADRDHGTILDKIPETDDPVAQAILEFIDQHARK
ncbi:MAG TPA: alpha/beta hydrolase [Armatimonadota bacterium]|nr:alpha/beta hydrolase [Armatimonadota bacterium]